MAAFYPGEDELIVVILTISNRYSFGISDANGLVIYHHGISDNNAVWRQLATLL